jgi:hypothetical protein
MVKWHRREELSGKEVIDQEAKRIGTVKDLAYSADGKLALSGPEGRGARRVSSPSAAWRG